MRGRVVLDGRRGRRGTAVEPLVRDQLVQHGQRRRRGRRAAEQLAPRNFVAPTLSHWPLLKQILGEAKTPAPGDPRAEYDRHVIATSDYELVTEAAGLVDRSDRAQARPARRRGRATSSRARSRTTWRRSPPGSGCYAAILNHKGKLRTDLRVLRGEDWFWLDCEPIGHAVLRHMVETYSLGRDVQFEDVTAEHAILSLIGPAARTRSPTPPPPPGEHALRRGRARASTCAPHLGVDVLSARPSRADGCAPRSDVEEVSEEAGRVPAHRVGPAAARPRHGRRHDPAGGGHQRARRELREGLLRRPGDRRAPALQGQAEPPPARPAAVRARPSGGAEILLGEKVVGRVGSTCVSPRLGPIALALVRREAAPGDEVLVAGAAAHVAELPFDA